MTNLAYSLGTYENLNAVEVVNSCFALDWLKINDVMHFEEAPPSVGDITLLEYKGRIQPVWLVGFDGLGRYIICAEFLNYPKASVLPRTIDFKYKLVRNNSYV